MYSIVYRTRAIEEFKSIDPSTARQILKSVESKLSSHPTQFGKPLRNELRNIRVLRVGDWRILFTIAAKEVLVMTIRHRKNGYEDLAV